MEQKSHIIHQKGLKMYKKKMQKMECSDPEYLLFSGIFLSRIGGKPPPPTLNRKNLLWVGGWYPPFLLRIFGLEDFLLGGEGIPHNSAKNQVF